MTQPKQPAKMGLWTSTSLVVGNMSGSGVCLLPASLAAYGGISLLGWIGSSAGAIVLALLFSKLSKMMPNALGGPYAAREAGSKKTPDPIIFPTTKEVLVHNPILAGCFGWVMLGG